MQADCAHTCVWVCAWVSVCLWTMKTHKHEITLENGARGYSIFIYTHRRARKIHTKPKCIQQAMEKTDNVCYVYCIDAFKLLHSFEFHITCTLHIAHTLNRTDCLESSTYFHTKDTLTHTAPVHHNYFLSLLFLSIFSFSQMNTPDVHIFSGCLLRVK